MKRLMTLALGLASLGMTLPTPAQVAATGQKVAPKKTEAAKGGDDKAKACCDKNGKVVDDKAKACCDKGGKVMETNVKPGETKSR